LAARARARVGHRCAADLIVARRAALRCAGTLFVSFVGFLSYVTVTWVVEAIAAANAVLALEEEKVTSIDRVRFRLRARAL
jgi:hypothetical protein